MQKLVDISKNKSKCKNSKCSNSKSTSSYSSSWRDTIQGSSKEAAKTTATNGSVATEIAANVAKLMQ
jgi:hypothetical protein